MPSLVLRLEVATTLRSQNLPSKWLDSNAHNLKPKFNRNVGPSDIDVVAALGDYLVAGSGALANTTIDTFKDFPQVSFAIGKKIYSIGDR